jgi:hypothetical protein
METPIRSSTGARRRFAAFLLSVFALTSACRPASAQDAGHIRATFDKNSAWAQAPSESGFRNAAHAPASASPARAASAQHGAAEGRLRLKEPGLEGM